VSYENINNILTNKCTKLIISYQYKTKLLIYKIILNSIWTYGIPLWGTAGNSNIEILQSYQNKILRAIANAPWYISNKVIHADLQVDKITTHPNDLAST
jgi:hypothetical protein